MHRFIVVYLVSIFMLVPKNSQAANQCIEDQNLLNRTKEISFNLRNEKRSESDGEPGRMLLERKFQLDSLCNIVLISLNERNPIPSESPVSLKAGTIWTAEPEGLKCTGSTSTLSVERSSANCTIVGRTKNADGVSYHLRLNCKAQTADQKSYLADLILKNFLCVKGNVTKEIEVERKIEPNDNKTDKRRAVVS